MDDARIRLLAATVAGAAGGTVAALVALKIFRVDPWVEKLKRLPERIILVRHGESEGNCDHTLYRTKADNLIELTDKGSEQAVEVGKRIKRLVGAHKFHLFVSPFVRTLQTARNLRVVLDNQVVHTYITPQIREQEFGNLQGDDFNKFRAEQQKIGRLYYRFPTGESGCDVFDRVRSWWQNLLEINERPSERPVESVVVVTHGLTMRLILMQLNGWSPETFHSVWNAGNCSMYVLRKNLAKKGFSPYMLDTEEGDALKSSHLVVVELTSGEKKSLLIEDYLSIPQPRTRQFDIAKKMIETQHGILADTIKEVDFFANKFSKYR